MKLKGRLLTFTSLKRSSNLCRVYTWKYHGCQKSYGSEGSLNQHMKNKHPEFYQQYTEALNLNEGIMPKIDGSGSASYSNNKQSKTSR